MSIGERECVNEVLNVLRGSAGTGKIEDFFHGHSHGGSTHEEVRLWRYEQIDTSSQSTVQRIYFISLAHDYKYFQLLNLFQSRCTKLYGDISFIRTGWWLGRTLCNLGKTPGCLCWGSCHVYHWQKSKEKVTMLYVDFFHLSVYSIYLFSLKMMYLRTLSSLHIPVLSFHIISLYNSYLPMFILQIYIIHYIHCI